MNNNSSSTLLFYGWMTMDLERVGGNGFGESM